MMTAVAAAAIIILNVEKVGFMQVRLRLRPRPRVLQRVKEEVRPFIITLTPAHVVATIKVTQESCPNFEAAFFYVNGNEKHNTKYSLHCRWRNVLALRSRKSS
jgi:hypothetical protein